MNQQGHPNDTATAIYLCIAAVLLWFGWHVFHQQITSLVGMIRHGELWLVLKFISADTAKHYHVREWFDYLGDRRVKLQWANIHQPSKLVGHFLRYPVAVILAILGYIALFKAPGSGPKKVFGLDQLIRAQAQMWPVISPIVNFNPAKSSARDPDGSEPIPETLPLFAEALSPDEWLRFYQISPYNRANKRPGTDPLDEDAAYLAFAEQLGPRWRDAASLPWHTRCLFAAFALKAARMRDEADVLLGRLAQAADPKRDMKLQLSPVLRRDIMRIVNDPKIGGAAAAVCDRHAFVATALLSLLLYARNRGGVLAPAQFLWLRGADRTLWYPLNNLGRQAFHTEAAGAMAHFQAEMVAGNPLFSPKVWPAVETLKTFAHGKNQMLPAIVA